MLAVEALTEAGFEVVEADHADGALAFLNGRANQVDLLFTDVNMPGAVDGLELAHFVQNSWPAIAVLITSGKARLRPADLPPGASFLTKPYECYRVVEVARALTEVS